MVYKCIVPKCRGNYKKNGQKVSTFGFPKNEELRKKWISSIPRDCNITKNSRVSRLIYLISLPDNKNSSLNYKYSIF